VRHWHNRGGGVYYDTITVRWDIIPDFIVENIDPGTQKAEPGKIYTGMVYQETTYDDNIVKAEIPLELVNLKVTDISLSPNPGEPGQLASGVITVLNESEKGFSGVKVIWRVRRSDGTVLDENTIITDLAAGESKQLPFSFTPDRGDTYSVAAMVNPDGDWPPDEVNFLSGDWPGDNRNKNILEI